MARQCGVKWAPLIVAGLLFGCHPPDRSGTVTAYVYAHDPATRGYSLRKAEVHNLESLRALRGTAVEVRSGTELNETLDGVELDRGTPFNLEYEVDDDGTIIPADQHSLYALTVYRNFDQAAALLRAHGHVQQGRLPILYFPKSYGLFVGDIKRSMLSDNASYYPEFRCFLILPGFMLADLPLAINYGVHGHEYGHAVIDAEALNGDEWESLLPEGARAYAATHEGVADLIGFSATGDPNYILPTAELDRDLAEPRDYLPEHYRQLNLGLGFEAHEHGSIMARAIYELWPKAADGQVSEAERGRLLDVILQALRALSHDPSFPFASFPNQLVLALQPPERAAACAVLLQRLAPVAHELTACEP
jgi:hypothetical protein